MMQQVISLALPPLLLLILLSSSFWLNDNNVAMAKTLQQAGKNFVLLQIKDKISTQQNYATDYDDDDELEPRRHQQSFNRKSKQPKQRNHLKYQNYKQQQQQQQQIKSRIPEEETSTTERPLIRYWNSFVRSVTVPMSNLRLNITNSLANFFNEGNANIMETPPLEINDYQSSEPLTYIDSGNSKKRSRVHKKKRKSTIESYSSTSRFGDQTAAVSYYYDQTTPYYYFDSKTGKYYGLRPLTNNNDYYKQLQLYNYYYPVNGQVLHAYDYYNNENDMILNRPPVKKYKPVSKPPKIPEETTSLSDAGEDEQIQDDAMNNDDDDDDDSNVDELNNVVYNNDDVDDDDEDIAVVEKLEDDEDEDENEEQPTQTEAQIDESNQEQLRNELGSFMRDDRFSRLRQRTADQQDLRINKNKPLDKQGPRQQKYKYNYYLNV